MLILIGCRPERISGPEISADHPAPLHPGRTLRAKLQPDGIHRYLVNCTAGQAVEVEVRQRGMNILLAGRTPGGRALDGVDDPFGPFGRDSLMLVAGSGGACNVEVRAAADPTRPAGYEITLRRLEPARPADSTRVSAQERFAAARRAEAKATAEGYAEAVSTLQEALGRWRAAGAHEEELLTLNHLGYLCLRTGEPERSQAVLAQALALARRLGTAHGEGLTLSNLGKLAKVRGDDRAALGFHLAALPLVRAAGDRFNEALIQIDAGTAATFQGKTELALSSLEATLALSRALGSRELEAAALHNLATVHQQADEPRQALALFRRVLALDGPGGGRGRAATLNQIGLLYRRLGRPDLALDQYREALRLVRRAGDREWQARQVQNIATAQEELGDRRQAFELHTQALALAREVGDRLVEARSSSALARLLQARGQGRRAREHAERALKISRELGDPYGVLFASRIKAEIAGAEGDLATAGRAYDEALALSRDLGAPSIEAMVLLGRARLRARRNALEPAATDALAAIDRIESVRSRVLGDDLRSSYVASVHAAYATAVDLLMRLHAQHPRRQFAERALQVSERGRARGLVEALAAAQLDVRRTGASGLAERERAVRRRLNATSALRFRLLRRGAPATQLEPLERDLRALESTYQEILARLRPRDAALVQPPVLEVSEIRAQLDPGTLLLVYSLGDERSYLWAVTRERVAAHVLPSRARIEALVRPLYEALRHGEATEQLPELSRLLLGPLPAPDLAASRRLVIVADGALHYVPFAALPLPALAGPDRPMRIPLLSHAAVVHLPSASVLPLLRSGAARRADAGKTLAILADPVFDRHDPRLRRQIAPRFDLTSSAAASSAPNRSFPRLPYTRREALAIAGLAARGNVLLALGFDASRDLATGGGLARYDIVHFATHGFVDDAHPLLSGVVLSLVDRRGRETDGLLRLQDLYGMELDADLVVLSACSTAVGRELQGEGLIGLSRGFLHAGARRVVATLWPVDEAATAHLMQTFYTGLLRQHLPPAEALRRAQLAVAREPLWRSPSYWSGFVMQGEWR
ncbi:MAG TPA: CHAT domain-containing tetratricopeptide repeat protein [Thermoanaerobaculia bacterium]|nr:CHAT domain-containing tetratricopeptide repeat protein [Thermoanaerobaculia bacterium]